MPCQVTGFTPFFMVHGLEAVLPTDIDYGSPRVRAYTEEGNQVALEDAIDQLDESRDVALLRSAKYQQALRRYHERNVCAYEFQVGNQVLRRVQGSKDRHKLLPLGRVHSSSTRCSDPRHSRSDTRMEGSSPMRGTSNTICHFILE
jgi:hypothetical protein